MLATQTLQLSVVLKDQGGATLTGRPVTYTSSAAQAVTVALAGGLLGTLIGLVAGVALAYPQTSNGWDSVTGEPMTLSPTIGIPILPMLATLIGVPLIAGFIAAIAIRKAPTVTRRA